MNSLELTSHGERRARTRSLIQVGALADKAGLLEEFGIIVGEDLQKSPAMKEPAAALFKGFLDLREMARSGEIHLPLHAAQGLEELRRLSQGRTQETPR